LKYFSSFAFLNNISYFVLNNSIATHKDPKRFTIAGFEPTIFYSRGGPDDHAAMAAVQILKTNYHSVDNSGSNPAGALLKQEHFDAFVNCNLMCNVCVCH
jgi:hypothetical protein